MHHILTLTLCTLFLTSSTSVYADDSAKEFVRKWSESFNSNNADEQINMYDNSKELVVIASSGVKFSGYEEFKSTSKEQFEAVKFRESKIINLKVRSVDKISILNFDHEMKFTDNSNGDEWKLYIRTAMVLHKTKGKLKIVYEHSSPIHGIDRLTPIK